MRFSASYWNSVSFTPCHIIDKHYCRRLLEFAAVRTVTVEIRLALLFLFLSFRPLNPSSIYLCEYTSFFLWRKKPLACVMLFSQDSTYILQDKDKDFHVSVWGVHRLDICFSCLLRFRSFSEYVRRMLILIPTQVLKMAFCKNLFLCSSCVVTCISWVVSERIWDMPCVVGYSSLLCCTVGFSAEAWRRAQYPSARPVLQQVVLISLKIQLSNLTVYPAKCLATTRYFLRAYS